MKIGTNSAPIFVPVTLTIESAEELQLVSDLFGQSSGSIGKLYDLGSDFMYDRYKELKSLLDARDIAYANKIDVTVK